MIHSLGSYLSYPKGFRGDLTFLNPHTIVPEGSLLWWCEPPLPHTFSETVFAPICLTGLRAFLREKIGRVAVLARLCDRWKPDVSRQSRRLQCQSGSWKVSGGLLLGCLVGVELSRRKFYFCPAVGSLPDLKSDD